MSKVGYYHSPKLSSPFCECLAMKSTVILVQEGKKKDDDDVCVYALVCAYEYVCVCGVYMCGVYLYNIVCMCV